MEINKTPFNKINWLILLKNKALSNKRFSKQMNIINVKLETALESKPLQIQFQFDSIKWISEHSKYLIMDNIML